MASQQAPPSLGFSRQEHWSGLPFPSPMHKTEKWKWSTLSDLMNCSLPGSSVHGIFQARVLEWGAIAFSVKRPLVFPILLFSCISLYFSLKQALELCIQLDISCPSPFLFLAIYKASSDNHLSSCISFSLGWFSIPPPVQWYEPPSLWTYSACTCFLLPNSKNSTKLRGWRSDIKLTNTCIISCMYPPSLGFSRQEHWSGLPFPSPMHETEK